ncbi:hypothetical protein ACIPSE_12720 [Streptomyces sp. NPDC090106]|uniref:hypothetical protein n=1 Tax=Streptomyces sp. NPDC090106 TaxID=3365946 RepID=UPI0037FB7ECB
MIRPDAASVSRIGESGAVWLYFDAGILVEITSELALTLRAHLADELGMVVLDDGIDCWTEIASLQPSRAGHVSWASARRVMA